jgi:hypothetical protein
MDDLERRESSRQDWASCNHYKIMCCLPESFHRDYDGGGPQWWWLTPMRCCITNAVGWSVMAIWRQRGQRQRPTTPVCQETFSGYCVLCGAFKDQPGSGWPLPQRTLDKSSSECQEGPLSPTVIMVYYIKYKHEAMRIDIGTRQ